MTNEVMPVLCPKCQQVKSIQACAVQPCTCSCHLIEQGDYVLPPRDEGMYAEKSLARIMPAGIDIRVGEFVLVTEGEDRGRAGMVLSWRNAADGIGHQVTFAVQPWESTKIVPRLDRAVSSEVNPLPTSKHFPNGMTDRDRAEALLYSFRSHRLFPTIAAHVAKALGVARDEGRREQHRASAVKSSCSDCNDTGTVEDDATGALGYVVQKPCPRGCAGVSLELPSPDARHVAHQVLFHEAMNAIADRDALLAAARAVVEPFHGGYRVQRLPNGGVEALDALRKAIESVGQPGRGVNGAALGPPRPDCSYCNGSGVIGDGSPRAPRETCHCRNWIVCSVCKGAGRVSARDVKEEGSAR